VGSSSIFWIHNLPTTGSCVLGNCPVEKQDTPIKQSFVVLLDGSKARRYTSALHLHVSGINPLSGICYQSPKNWTEDLDEFDRDLTSWHHIFWGGIIQP